MDVASVGCNPAPVMLYREHDKDQMRPKPISTEKSEEVIVYMAAGLLTQFPVAYADAGFALTPEPRGNAHKVGRKHARPCGSGKKYKRCCVGMTVN